MGPAVLPLENSNLVKNGPSQSSVVPTCPARLAFTREDFLTSITFVFIFLNNILMSGLGFQVILQLMGFYLVKLRLLVWNVFAMT
jgi:hypothetical protein